MARLALGDIEAALGHLEPVAVAHEAPALLITRRQAVAGYAEALIVAGRLPEAVEWASRAIIAPGEDARSGCLAQRVLARALASDGELDLAAAYDRACLPA